MSILVDIGGNSTNTSIIGLLIHLTANTKDGKIPHTTSLQHDPWEIQKDKVEIISLGRLSDNKYMIGSNSLPPYLVDPTIPTNIHLLISDPQINIPIKRCLLSLLASAVYEYMLINDRPIWSSTMNCQQFARRFVIEGLGLNWPNDVQVADDTLPTSIDTDVLF